MEEETKANVPGPGKIEELKPSVPQVVWNEKTQNTLDKLFEKITAALMEGRLIKISQGFTDVASEKDEATGVHKVKIGSGFLISFLIDLGAGVVVESEGIEELNKRLEAENEELGKEPGL